MNLMTPFDKKRKEFVVEKLKEPDTYRNRYVAFLDLLGFKNIANQMDCASIKALFNDIEFIKFSFDELLGTKTFGVHFVDDVDFTIMSDSIVISVEGTDEGLAYLLFICATIQSRLFLSPTQMILLRGGISYGQYFKYNNLSYGPAMTNAYLLEGEASTPRIILDPNIAEKLKEKGIIGKVGINKYTHDYTPSTVNTVFDLCLIRSSEDGYFFVNFLHHLELCRLSQNEYIGKSNMQSIQNAIINGLKHSNDRVKQKYVWLCKFFNEQIDRSCLLNIEKYIITEDESVLFK